MSGNRFNRLPTNALNNSFMDAFNRAMSSAEAANDMQVANNQTHPTPVSYTHLTLPTNREV